MAKRRRDRDADLERGGRLRAIREELGYNQYDFVERLNITARDLGLPAGYRYYTVSRLEAGSMGFEDVTVYVALDPQKRGWEWLVWGDQRRPPLADPALFRRVKSTGKADGRSDHKG